jgi:hypothetical protein
MFDLITILTASRALRRACEARCADLDNAEAEHDARIALLDLARGLELEVYPSRPSRWTGTDAMASNVQTAAEALAEAAQGDFYPAGHIARLTLHFGALASRMGCDVDTAPRLTSDTTTEDEIARRYAEGHRQEAAE